MATKPAIPVNKKIPIATKQVPAKKSVPAKPAAKASVTIKKPAGVTTKQAIVNHVKVGVIGTQVAEAMKSGSQAKVDAANKLLKANKIGLKVVPVKKAEPVAAPKKATTSTKPTVASVTLTKGEAKKFYSAKTPAEKTAVAAKAMLKGAKIPAAAKKAVVEAVVKTATTRPSIKAVPAKKTDAPAKKDEPAKKPLKAVTTKTVPAVTQKTTAVEVQTPTPQTTSPAGTHVSTNQPRLAQVNKFLESVPENPYVKQTTQQTAPQVKLPPEMPADKALEREKLLRQIFISLNATSRIST